MNLRLLGLTFLLALPLAARTDMTVGQLVQLVRSEMASNPQTDKQLAAYLKKEVHLTERLSEKTIEDLKMEGAGPHTVDALLGLRNQSASLKVPAHEATSSPSASGGVELGPGSGSSIPPPDSVRQGRILDVIRQYAVSYEQELPNFICLQVTRQYTDRNANGDVHHIQTINAQLSYDGKEEKRTVISVNGKLTNSEFDRLSERAGGAVSTGEFGGMLKSIFDPQSQATISWDHWGKWDGKLVAVYRYSIERGHSDYRVKYGGAQQIITSYKGLVYADPSTGIITHITLQAVDIPASFPVSQVSETLTFRSVEISGKNYLCPQKAELWMRADGEEKKNEIEFRLYRKFETGTQIFYGPEAQQ